MSLLKLYYTYCFQGIEKNIEIKNLYTLLTFH